MQTKTIHPFRTKQASNGLTIHLTKTGYKSAPLSAYVVDNHGKADEILMPLGSCRRMIKAFDLGADEFLRTLNRT